MTRNFMALSLKAFWNCVTIRLQKPKRQWGFSWPWCRGADDCVDGGMEVASDILSRARCWDYLRHRRTVSSALLVPAAGINLPGVGVSFNGFRGRRCEGGVIGGALKCAATNAKSKSKAK